MLQATAATIPSPQGNDTTMSVPPRQDDKDKTIAPNTWKSIMSSLDHGWKISYNATLGWCNKPYAV